MKLLKDLRQAFLYELLIWMNEVDFDVSISVRQLTKEQIIIYFKEVFIKHQIQGWDFRYLDSSDVEYLQMNHFPKTLAQWSKERSLLLVESKDYWFLIGQASNVNQNPFSFGRFLHEDGEGEFIYITHIVVPRRQLKDIEVAKSIAYQVSRIYTLDRGVSEEILKFVRESRMCQENYLRPLLKKPLVNDGSGAENIVNTRMVDYEKQLSLFVLKKLPKIFNAVSYNQDDLEYLYYQVSNFIKDCRYAIEDFMLQPLANYAVCSQTMSIRLNAYNAIIQKNKNILSNPNLSLEEKIKLLTKPYTDIVDLFEEFDQEKSSLAKEKEAIRAFMSDSHKKNFWQKLGFGYKKPKYTLEEIDEMNLDLNEKFFIDIVKMAKVKPNLIVYAEFENNQIYHNDYRHYAFLYSPEAVDRLPKVIRLPEDRQHFDVNALGVEIFDDAFKQSQEW